MLQRYLLILLSFGLPIASMQPPKSDADQMVAAAGAGNIKGLNYWIKTKKMSPDTFNSDRRSALSMAAGNAQVESVKYLLDANANPNIQDINGLTPLHWASLVLDQNKPETNYLDIINQLLAKGARLDILDKNGLSVLHGAARAGNLAIIKLLLDSGARGLVNNEGAQEKGRTPLAEAVRASRDALIHVDLENKEITSKAEFVPALNEAIAQLKKKEEKKLATPEIIQVINLLKRYDARTDMQDALGHKLSYYIDEVQLISDAERAQLLSALNAPITPRTVQYTLADLPQAIRRLENIRDEISTSTIAQKISMVVWTLQEVQRASNPVTQYDMLRVAMALLSKVKEVAKATISNAAYFTDLESEINRVRTILRDSALVVSNKAHVNAIPKPMPSTTPAAAAQELPRATEGQTKASISEQGFLITDVMNYSPHLLMSVSYYNLGEKQKITERMPVAQHLGSPAKLTLNRVVSFIDIANPNLSQSFFWSEEKPTIIENIQKKIDLPRNTYAVSKIIQTADGIIKLEPDLNINQAASKTEPEPVKPPAQPNVPQVTLDINSMYITDLLNYSDKPAKLTLHLKASGQNQEFMVNAAKNKSTPTMQEVLRAGHPNLPVTVESFNQKVTLEVIPADPTKPGKATEVKKQIINSKEPIKYWRLSDVKQVQIVIAENGDIKVVPVKKFSIIDYHGK